MNAEEHVNNTQVYSVDASRLMWRCKHNYRQRLGMRDTKTLGRRAADGDQKRAHVAQGVHGDHFQGDHFQGDHFQGTQIPGKPLPGKPLPEKQLVGSLQHIRLTGLECVCVVH